MAAMFASNVMLHAAIVLLISWSYARTCLGINKDPKSQFFGHTMVQPFILKGTREKRDLQSIKAHNEEKLTLGFVAFDKNFVLKLQMNKHFMPSHFFEKHRENGTHVVNSPLKKNPSHCHYQGHIQGNNNSWAAISTCNGISGVIFDGEEMHYIQPDHNSENSDHYFFKASDLRPQNLTCGFKNTEKKNLHGLDGLRRSRRSTVLHDPYKSTAKSRFIELIIVNDNKEFKEFNQDKAAVFQRSKEIGNIVNALYAPLNIFIALVGVIIWSEHDEIKLSTDGDATLTNFLHYRKERLAQEHPNDNAQLITAVPFENGVVGKSLKGPICTYEYSGGVSSDHSVIVGLVANTVAHEIGHCLGMEHDTDECVCSDDRCIMAPSSSSTSPKHWSSCSLEYLDLAYSQGMDYCLMNHPTKVISQCGNTFLDPGEQCDCGLKEFCDNKCCNATSCQMYSNASCAVGQCCDFETCQVKKVATPCREASSECDLPEFCDGVSEFCPSDTFKQNGLVCGKGKAYCYDGQCKSHGDQCKLLWGQTGKMADNRCFEQNYKGNVNGNCGYNRINQTYKACSKNDVLCGMLHCLHLNERLEFGMESAAILARSYINVKNKIFTCRSAIVDLGLFNTDPGLSPNGAKCGDGKLCVNQKCVAVSSIKQNECSYDCSNNGVCNNRGNCHCDLGYGAPYCDTPGPGGSVDSGPISDPYNYYVTIILYVTFFGLLPLIILSAAIIYYYRSHLKTWWSKKAHKANIKSRTKTIAQRKVQPPSKFNFDRNSLRTLEISGPIQLPSPAIPKDSIIPVLSMESNHCPAHPPSSGLVNSTQNKIVPVRPAPPRPNNAPQVTWTPTSTVGSSSISRTASLRCPADGKNRPLSASAFRPNCPPPRPPPPSNTTSAHTQARYENFPKSNDLNRSSTPPSNFYEDCQTLDFSNTPLAFVHTPEQESNPCDVLFRSKHNTGLAEKPSAVNKTNNISHVSTHRQSGSKVLPQTVKAGESSVVASLAQKFEKQDKFKSNSNFNNSLRPPFKSRPLPLRPDHPKI